MLHKLNHVHLRPILFIAPNPIYKSNIIDHPVTKINENLDYPTWKQKYKFQNLFMYEILESYIKSRMKTKF